MIILEGVELYNFLNFFGNHELDLTKYRGLISINGVNGAGKSSLITTVAFCLFGMIKGNNIYSMVNSIAFANKEKMSVTTKLLDESTGERKSFTRGINAKGSYFEVDGKALRLKDFNDILEKYLGVLNSKVFENIFYFKQSDIMDFLTNEEIRNEIFEVFLDLRIWAIMEETVVKFYSSKKGEYDELLMRLEIAKENIIKLEHEISGYDIGNCNKEIDRLKAERDIVNAELGQLSVKNLVIEKDDLYNKLIILKKAKEYKEQLAKNLEEENVLLQKIEQLGVTDETDAQKCMEELGQVKSEALTIRQILGNIGTRAKCPVLSENCDLLGKRKDVLEGKVTELANSQLEKEKIVNKYNQLKGFRRSIDTIQNNNAVMTDYLNGIKQELWDSFENMKARYLELQKMIDNVKLVQNEKQNLLKNLEKEINIYNDEIIRCKTLVGKKAESEDQIVGYEKDVRTFEEELDYIKIVREVFSDDGIRNYIYQNTGALLVNEWNLFLGKVLTDVSVNFVFSKDLTKKTIICSCGEKYSGKTCKKCGKTREKETRKVFDVVLIRDGKEYSFDSMSGGEKTIIATSLRFALYKIYSELFHKTLGVMFIDEIFGMLDDENMGKMIDVLNLFSQMVEVRHIFCISHVYKEQNFDHEITIKDNAIMEQM